MNLRHSRHGVVVSAVAAVLLLLLAPWSPSQAANPRGAKPTTGATAQASATVSGSTASLTAQVSRPASDVSSLACAVSGQAAYSPACSLKTSSRKGGASYAASMSGLSAGSYTFTARFTLTDGTTAQASATFTVGSSQAPSGPQATCQSYGGTFTSDANGWDCDAPAAAYSALAAQCTGVSVWTYYTPKGGTSRVSYSCSGMRV